MRAIITHTCVSYGQVFLFDPLSLVEAAYGLLRCSNQVLVTCALGSRLGRATSRDFVELLIELLKLGNLVDACVYYPCVFTYVWMSVDVLLCVCVSIFIFVLMLCLRSEVK